ncbi:MAG: hypothetical protein N2444_08520, partial [Methylocystis sp.]|nr:hypothetical protein [Methylocystis sp.]
MTSGKLSALWRAVKKAKFAFANARSMARIDHAAYLAVSPKCGVIQAASLRASVICACSICGTLSAGTGGLK